MIAQNEASHTLHSTTIKYQSLRNNFDNSSIGKRVPFLISNEIVPSLGIFHMHLLCSSYLPIIGSLSGLVPLDGTALNPSKSQPVACRLHQSHSVQLNSRICTIHQQRISIWGSFQLYMTVLCGENPFFEPCEMTICTVDMRVMMQLVHLPFAIHPP